MALWLWSSVTHDPCAAHFHPPTLCPAAQHACVAGSLRLGRTSCRGKPIPCPCPCRSNSYNFQCLPLPGMECTIPDGARIISPMIGGGNVSRVTSVRAFHPPLALPFPRLSVCVPDAGSSQERVHKHASHGTMGARQWSLDNHERRSCAASRTCSVFLPVVFHRLPTCSRGDRADPSPSKESLAPAARVAFQSPQYSTVHRPGPGGVVGHLCRSLD